jgi:hypothetical protein
MIPTLKQLLAERALARTPTDAWVEWAVDQLMRGQETPHLRILAGERAPFNAFEVWALLDTVFRELDVQPPGPEEAVRAYAAELASSLVQSEGRDVAALRLLRDLAIERQYPDYLHDFYLLAFAEQDLTSGGVQFYWQGATPTNVYQIIHDRAAAWLAAGAPSGTV